MKFNILPCAILALLLTNITAVAQVSKSQGLLLNVHTSILHDSNILRNNEELADNSLLISPVIGFYNSASNYEFALGYVGEYSKYNKQSTYDYSDHEVTVETTLRHAPKFSSRYNIRYKNGIEAPGSTNSIILSDELNDTEQLEFEAQVFYGTVASQGQVVLGLNLNRNQFDNNQQSFRNTDSQGASLSFFYRLAPRTRVFLASGIKDYKYNNPSELSDQSSTQTDFYAGIEWKASEQFTNTFKFGYLSKDYDQEQFNRISGLSYNLDFLWTPNNFTAITLGAARTTNESATEGTSGYLSTDYTIAVKHELTSLFSLQGKLSASQYDLNGRNDDRTNISLVANYSVRYWLDISLEYVNEDRNSSSNLFVFESELIQLTFSTTFE